MKYVAECAVGPDQAGECLNEEVFVWMITHYTIGDYCGDGFGAALRKDGIVEIANLGHCSCYGPEDGWSSTEKIPVADFLNEVDPNVPGRKRDAKDCDYTPWQAIIVKARELQKVQ